MTEVLTEMAARAQKYAALTVEFELPREQWMLDNVLEDMRNGKVPHVLVEQPKGPEVWRRGIQREKCSRPY